jgi:hypothetical protein
MPLLLHILLLWVEASILTALVMGAFIRVGMGPR